MSEWKTLSPTQDKDMQENDGLVSHSWRVLTKTSANQTQKCTTRPKGFIPRVAKTVQQIKICIKFQTIKYKNP